MITIFHGENVIASREALAQAIQQAKQKNQIAQRLEAKRITTAELEQALSSNNLFGDTQLTIIEELHSLPTSARKKELIELISKYSDAEIIIWEKKTITATMLKKFPNNRNQEFKITKALFKWTESVGTKLATQEKLKLLDLAIKQDSDQLCFIMLIRQIRMLFQALEGNAIAGPPFMVQKIRAQAQHFSLQQLQKLHADCYTIDRQMKTSTLPLPLSALLQKITISNSLSY